jgi:hypothetical protein
MKRDKNLIRLLLQQVRDGGEPEGLAQYSEPAAGFHAALLVDEGFVDGSSVRDETGQYIGASMFNLTSKGYDLLDESEAGREPAQRSKQTEMNVSVFISHSSADKEVAEALIAVLRLALSLPSGEIRCTRFARFSWVRHPSFSAMSRFRSNESLTSSARAPFEPVTA